MPASFVTDTLLIIALVGCVGDPAQITLSCIRCPPNKLGQVMLTLAFTECFAAQTDVSGIYWEVLKPLTVVAVIQGGS